MKTKLSFCIFLLLLAFSCKDDETNPSNDPPPGTVTDIEGNSYHTVTINDQIWMVENLKTTKYNDGTSIPLITSAIAWEGSTTPGYCWYNNDQATYGALYNWHVVNTGKLAPTGWRVATDTEWLLMSTYLGGQNAAGAKLKEAGTTHWIAPNTGATNETGFTALPSGIRYIMAGYTNVGEATTWWTSSDSTATTAVVYGIQYNYTKLVREEQYKWVGYSVRCIKD